MGRTQTMVVTKQSRPASKTASRPARSQSKKIVVSRTAKPSRQLSHPKPRASVSIKPARVASKHKVNRSKSHVSEIETVPKVVGRRGLGDSSVSLSPKRQKPSQSGARTVGTKKVERGPAKTNKVRKVRSRSRDYFAAADEGPMRGSLIIDEADDDGNYKLVARPAGRSRTHTPLKTKVSSGGRVRLKSTRKVSLTGGKSKLTRTENTNSRHPSKSSALRKSGAISRSPKPAVAKSRVSRQTREKSERKSTGLREGLARRTGRPEKEVRSRKGVSASKSRPSQAKPVAKRGRPNSSAVSSSRSPIGSRGQPAKKSGSAARLASSSKSPRPGKAESKGVGKVELSSSSGVRLCGTKMSRTLNWEEEEDSATPRGRRTAGRPTSKTSSRAGSRGSGNFKILGRPDTFN